MGIRETFTILGGARSSKVVPALLHGLDEGNTRVVAAAAAALMEQRSPEGFLELLKRYESFEQPVKDSIAQSLYRLRDQMPQFVKGAAGPIRQTLLNVLKSNTSVDSLPILALYLESDDAPEMRRDAAAAMGAIVSRFDEEKKAAEGAVTKSSGRLIYSAASLERFRFDLDTACRALDKALETIADHRSPEIVRACCQIGSEGHDLLINVIEHGGHAGEARTAILEMLRADDSVHTMDFIFSLIGEKDEVLRKMGVELLRGKSSPECVESVLRALIKIPQERQRQLIKVNRGLPWLPVIGSQINRLPRKYARFLYAEVDKLEGEASKKVPYWTALANSNDKQIHDLAIEKLSDKLSSDSRNSLAGLLESGDEEVQLKVVNTLIEENPGDLTHMLAPCMSSSFDSVRKAAGQAIARAGFDQYVQSFDALDEQTRGLAGRAFAELDKEHLDDLLSALGDVDSRKRIKAIRILQATGNHKKVANDVLELVNDPDKMVRATIIRLLVAMRNNEAIKALIKLLDDKDSRVQANAVEAIEELKEPKLRQVLVPFLRHPNNRVRGNACKALWTLGVKDVIPVVFAMLEDANPKMRMTAAWVMSEIKPEGAKKRIDAALAREEDKEVLKRLEKAEKVLGG